MLDDIIIPTADPIPKDDSSEEIARILSSLKQSGEDSRAAESVKPQAIVAEPLFPTIEAKKVIEVEAVPVATMEMPEVKPQEVKPKESVPTTPPGANELLRQYSDMKQHDADKSHTFSVLKKASGALLALLPYIIVFSIGVAGYYLFIADKSAQWNIAFWNKQEDPLAVSKKEHSKIFEDAKAGNAEEYNKWIAQFFFKVTDEGRLAMDTVSPNGFTNFENFLLKLNPKTRDADSNGKMDALDVMEGRDPETGKALSDSQKDALAKFIIPDEVKSRLESSVVPAPATLAPPIPVSKGLLIRGVPAGQVASASTTAGSEPNGAPALRGSGISQKNISYENKYAINTQIPGRLEIPSIGINVPIVWTSSSSNFDEDLKKGIVHHPQTPLPGDRGTSYISGHSSNYAWARADFNKIFAKLNDLPVGGTFKVTVVNNAGKDIKLYYTVDSKQIFKANDQTQFLNFADSRVALSTCWPIGTLEKRLVAFGKLTRVEE